MRITPVFPFLILAILAGCAGNPGSETGQARVRDTTLTAADTLAPGDTLDRARRVAPDTAGGVDTTSTGR